MLMSFFQNRDKSIEKRKIKVNEPLPNNTFWIDLIKPMKAEERYIEKVLNIEAPLKKRWRNLKL